MSDNKDKSTVINFSVSLNEANKIFKALGTLPFVEVYELIGKLNAQANHQLAAKDTGLGNFIPDSSGEDDNDTII